MTSIDVVPCPECGRPFGEHTVVEYREHTATRLEFQAVESPTFEELAPGGQIIVDHVDVAAVVLQLTTEMASVVHLPGVEFRFHSSSGTVPPPIVFVADSERTWKDLARLVAQACGAAPLRARQASRHHAAGSGEG
ncbi:MAG: hypothetical protein R2761_16120 [Acidimicrobiales bacterium]